jgi:SEC-C motif-containing protein
MTNCPCGSGTDFDTCCGPIISGTPAPTAEGLMRLRFTAYAKGELEHVEKTLAEELRGGNDPSDT